MKLQTPGYPLESTASHRARGPGRQTLALWSTPSVHTAPPPRAQAPDGDLAAQRSWGPQLLGAAAFTSRSLPFN